MPPGADLGQRCPWALLTLGLLLSLGTLAVLAPAPAYETDRDIYQQIGRTVILPDCSSLHCTRILIAPLLERLPMASLSAWKTYAVAANTIGALGVTALCLAFGLGPVLSVLASAMVALGRGAQLTVFDPYTSDPFIYALVPWMTWLLLHGRVARAGVLGTVGVFAKEFAAGPLWIVAVFGLITGRRDLGTRASFAAFCATTTWLLFQLWAALHHNYSFGGNPSSRLLAGGYLVTWVRALGPLRAAESLVLHLGPIAFLAAVGLGRAPGWLKQLAIASGPAMLALCYVQQPDRAMWNFAWLLVPLAVTALDRQPPWLVAGWLLTYGVSNLPSASDHIGIPVVAAFLLCSACTLRLAATLAPPRFRGTLEMPPSSTEARPPVIVSAGTAAALCVCTAGLLVALDISMHRNHESEAGLNIWGYRGPVARHKTPGELRVVVLGGSTVFGRALQGSIPLFLEQYLNLGWMRASQHYDRPGTMTVANLATPYDRVQAFDRTLQDFESLDYDIVCFYVGHDDPVPSQSALEMGWRRQSVVFRRTGYLPVVPAMLTGRIPGTATPEVTKGPEPIASDIAALDTAVSYALARNKAVLVATHPFLTAEEASRQDAIGAHLRERFGADRRFGAIDVRTQVDAKDEPASARIAEIVCYALFRLLKQTL